MHFYHLTIITKDFEKSLKFYTEFVGLNVNRYEDVPEKHKLAMLAEKGETETFAYIKGISNKATYPKDLGEVQ